jgi:hypothetical protein
MTPSSKLLHASSLIYSIFVYFFIFAHFFVCVRTSLIEQYKTVLLDPAKTGSFYLNNFYFILTTCYTIGYGDSLAGRPLSPQTKTPTEMSSWSCSCSSSGSSSCP